MVNWCVLITSEDIWTPSAQPVPLGRGEVHLWRISLADHEGRLTKFAGALIEEERLRAERFRFDLDRNLYVLSRGALRLLLAAYTGQRADQLEFRYGSQGKPSIDSEELQFNLSHSGGLCTAVFARDIRVGVDIEEKSRDASFLDLAERFFAPSERRALASMPEERIRDAFYAVWTRKEAYIKALGEGVTHGLDNFSVTVEPGEERPMVHSDRDPLAAETWSMISFEPKSGFAGAMAMEGHGHRITTLEYVRDGG